MSGRYRFGQVLWVYFRFEKGGGYKSTTKSRPVIIIDDDDSIDEDEIMVVPVSTKFTYPLTEYQILVHRSHVHDSNTGMSQPSVAKCDESTTISSERIDERRGLLADDLLDAVVDAFDRFYEN